MEELEHQFCKIFTKNVISPLILKINITKPYPTSHPVGFTKNVISPMSVRFFSTKHGSLGGDNYRSVATWGNSDSIRRLGGTYLIPIARRGSGLGTSICVPERKDGPDIILTFAACSEYLRIRMHIDRLTPSQRLFLSIWLLTSTYWLIP